MIKKIFAKLIGWREQRTGPDRFHQPDNIVRMNEKSHSDEAEERHREKEHRRLEESKEPNEAEILGPSESEEA